MIEDTVYNHLSSKKSNNSEFSNLCFYKTKFIIAKGELNLYWEYRSCKLILLLNSVLSATKIGNESDINVIKEVKLFFHWKIDNDSNNNKLNWYLYCPVLHLHINIVFDLKSWLRFFDNYV